MCGYLINVDNIPAYVVPVRWLSWYAHLNELLQANQWGGVSVDDLCIVRDDQPTTPFNYTYTGPMSFGTPIPVVVNLEDHEVCRLRFPDGGESIMKEMGFSSDMWWTNIAVLFLETVLIRILAYVIYKFRLRKLNKNSILWDLWLFRAFRLPLYADQNLKPVCVRSSVMLLNNLTFRWPI